MSAQTSYKFSTPVGMAGGIVDLAPYAIDTFKNQENSGVMKFGMAVVKGTTAGEQVKLPVSGSSATDFEGVTVNNLTTEYDMEGAINIRKDVPIGVMRYGRVYVRLATGVTPTYGAAAYFVKTGGEEGCFTTSSSSTVAVKGRFLGIVGDGIAELELFNQAQS